MLAFRTTKSEQKSFTHRNCNTSEQSAEIFFYQSKSSIIDAANLQKISFSVFLRQKFPTGNKYYQIQANSMTVGIKV